MRRGFFTSIALIWALALSTTLCVGGWCTAPCASPPQCGTQATCRAKKAALHFAWRGECSDGLRAPAAKCALRNLAQAQPAISRATKVSAPQRIATGKVSALFDFGFIVSSIGSPQTDRGPPLS